MAIIKAAIIGLGNMGQAHVQDVLNLPGLDLVALCDIDEVRLSTVAAKLPGPEVAFPAFVSWVRPLLAWVVGKRPGAFQLVLVFLN